MEEDAIMNLAKVRYKVHRITTDMSLPKWEELKKKEQKLWIDQIRKEYGNK